MVCVFSVFRWSCALFFLWLLHTVFGSILMKGLMHTAVLISHFPLRAKKGSDMVTNTLKNRMEVFLAFN